MSTSLALMLYFGSRPETQEARADSPPVALSDPENRLNDPRPDHLSSPLAPTSRVPAALPRREPVQPSLSNGPPPSKPKSTEPVPEPELHSAAWLPSEEQEKVNRAIDRGVEWLKQKQSAQGYRGFGIYPVGFSALVGLTLLECGVPHEDKHVQDALRSVRRGIPQLEPLHCATYQLSLALLLLDRYGDPSDEGLIRTCALRLIAGQSATGGWNYACPLLSPKDEMALLMALEQTRPTDALDLFVGNSGEAAPPGFIAQQVDKPREKKASDTPSAKKALARLPEPLRHLPALQSAKHSYRLPGYDVTRTDNSNTQFAILGLCAAQRHRLPVERSLVLIAQRFRKSQTRDGGWSYNYLVPGRQHTPSMTGAGLLGLAVGHGLAADYATLKTRLTRLDDPAIEKGFRVLAESIGEPLGSSQINLYFLWTLERVGVLYKRPQFGGKKWYPWGAKMLLDRQKSDGSWMIGGYPGTDFLTDTCFALLFLKRANPAKELTKKLEFFTEQRSLRTRVESRP